MRSGGAGSPSDSLPGLGRGEEVGRELVAYPLVEEKARVVHPIIAERVADLGHNLREKVQGWRVRSGRRVVFTLILATVVVVVRASCGGGGSGGVSGCSGGADGGDGYCGDEATSSNDWKMMGVRKTMRADMVS